MSKQALGLLVVSLLVLGFGAPAAMAQYGQDNQVLQLVIDVPWPFTVENTTLPAGKYEISQTRGTYDMPWEWTIADAAGAVKVIFSTEPDYAKAAPKADEATFDVVGSHHYLVGLWMAGATEGYYIPMTKAERMAWKKGTKPTKEAVALKKK